MNDESRPKAAPESAGWTTSSIIDRDLNVARRLTEHGVPVFVAYPNNSTLGFRLPDSWQTTTPNPRYVDAWRPGMALCAVMGRGLDLVDLDPRNGGSAASLNGLMPTVYGVAASPSNGWHGFVKSMGVRSHDNVLPGIDVKAGDAAGQGRGFVFLAPTVRKSKVTDSPVAYRWERPPDLDALAAAADDRSGEKLAELVRLAHSHDSPTTGDPFASFLKEPPWPDLAATLAKNTRHDAVHKLASALRGRGGFRVEDALQYMRDVVWPRLDQNRGGHPYTQEELEHDVRDVFSRYEDGGHRNGDSARRNGDQEASVRRIRLTPASAIKPRPVRWTWTNRIPAGEFTLTPGRGGIGKSTFHVWMIAHLTRGTLDGVHLGEPKPCIIAAAEDSWARTIVPRLIAAGADMALVYRVDVVTETDDGVLISLPRDVDGLIEEIDRVGAALLSVDPVMSVISYSLDSHKDADVRQALTPLARLADATGCAVLGNAHFNKSAGSDPLALVMGSAAFGNVARAALGFARDTEADDGSCVISQVKNNLGRVDLPSLRYRIDTAWIDTNEGPAEVGQLVMLGESDRSVADMVRDKGTDEDKAERNEVDQWLIRYLTDGGGQALAAEVIVAARRAGHSENAVKKARSRIKATSERTGFGKDAFYTWVLMDSMDSPFQKPGPHGIHGESMGDTPAGQMSACAACGQPMYVIEDGQTVHPMCEETP